MKFYTDPESDPRTISTNKSIKEDLICIFFPIKFIIRPLILLGLLGLIYELTHVSISGKMN